MPLLVKDLTIDSITGPVSMTLLVPEPDLVNAVKRNVPIVMLFGDEHFSEEGYCSQCSCNLKQKHCCYEIWSKEFLQVFDSLATKDKPIDFYIETFTNKTDIIQAKKDIYKYSKDLSDRANKGTMSKLRENLYTCYFRDLRGTKAYKELCPTSNIRWQFADARQGDTGFLESNLFVTNQFFYKIADLAKMGDSAIANETKASVAGLMSRSLLYEIETIGSHFRDSLELYIEFIKNPIYFISKMFGPDSEMFKLTATYKQIKKQQFPFNSLHYWSNIFNNYIKYIIAKHKFYVNSEYVEVVTAFSREISSGSKDLTQFFLDIFMTPSKKYIWSGVHPYMILTSIFLDIYFVTRILKKPDGGTEPFLVIGYFGDLHATHIAYLLETIMTSYVNLGRIESQGRCLKLEDTLDLNKISKVYNGDFTKTKSFLSKLLGK
jgi:hypothetical protein